MTATAYTPTSHEIETFDGRYLNLLRPDHRQIGVTAVAHALSQTCRYGGSCVAYFSVAEHAVLVAKKLRHMDAPISLQLAGLHHDDAEAFLGDIQRPMKPLIGDQYAALTRRMDRAIWRAIGCPDKDLPPLYETGQLKDKTLKKVDLWACGFEAQHIMRSGGENWENVWLQQDDSPIQANEFDCIDCLQPLAARAMFLYWHNLLVREHHEFHRGSA